MPSIPSFHSESLLLFSHASSFRGLVLKIALLYMFSVWPLCSIGEGFLQIGEDLGERAFSGVASQLWNSLSRKVSLALAPNAF